MPDDIKVPGLGDVPKKYVIGGVIVGGGIAVIVYIRARNKANSQQSSSAATSAGLVTDPAGNQCAALDPNSGYCPNTPEDTAYQSQYAYGSSGVGYGGDYGYPSTSTGTSLAGLVQDPAGNQCTAVNPATGYCPGTSQDISAQALQASSATSTTGTGTTTTGGAPTTNSQWLADALAVLPGGNSSANQTALASVLGGVTVTTAQKSIFLEAVGIIGNPPQGYPPINTSDTAAHPASQTPAGSSFKAAGPITGLTVLPSGTGMQAKWNAATGATQGYAWRLTGPTSKNGTTSSTVITIHNLPKGTYNFGIQALPGGAGNNGHVTVG